MKISEALLDIAQAVDLAWYGSVSAATLRSLTDSSLSLMGSQMTDSMLIVLSGGAAGNVRRVVSNKAGTVTVDRDFSALPVANDSFVICSAKYSRVYQAFRAAVQSGRAIFMDTTLIGVKDQTIYTLPVNVSNVTRVMTEDGINRYWHEQGNTLVFVKNKSPMAGRVITIFYRGRVVLNEATDQIVSSVSPEWLRWSGVAQYWRNEIQGIHKDNPIAADMVNEARAELKAATAILRSMDMAPDPRYFST